VKEYKGEIETYLADGLLASEVNFGFTNSNIPLLGHKQMT
jgi:hypothetical protein